jgi:hypothetical protein
VFESTDRLDATRFGDSRAADHSFRLPIGDLAPGAYALSFRASAGEAVAARDVIFQVKP